ncbi:MAG TPA: NAD(P)(+) transhydrogenase (Re/Si-specific) subunit beta, partial [Chloroflexia bacterium]
MIPSDSPILQIIYILAAVAIIIGLKRLSSPATARTGNLIAAVGVGIALLVTLFTSDIHDYLWIFIGVPI